MTLTDRSSPRPRTVPPVAEPRRLVPAKWWATIGAAYLALVVWLIVRWVGSAQFQRTPTGPDELSSGARTLAVVLDTVSPVAGAAVLWRFVIQPWRREGRLTTDGLICLAFLPLLFSDLWENYTVHTFQYSSYFANFGSWYDHVPGWVSPRGNLLAHPIAFVAPGYLYCVFMFTVIGCWLARRIQQRWANIGTVGTWLGVYLFIVAIDFTFEVLFLRTHLIAYPATIRSLTLFAGEVHQFPIYEAIVSAMFWTAMTAARFYRDDKGRTVAERGIERLSLSTRRETGMRFLAIVGLWSTLFFFCYHLPMNFIGVHADNWPDNLPSHLTNGVCGPGTPYTCPGEHIPIQREGDVTTGITAPANRDQESNLRFVERIVVTPSGGIRYEMKPGHERLLNRCCGN